MIMQSAILGCYDLIEQHCKRFESKKSDHSWCDDRIIDVLRSFVKKFEVREEIADIILNKYAKRFKIGIHDYDSTVAASILIFLRWWFTIRQMLLSL